MKIPKQQIMNHKRKRNLYCPLPEKIPRPDNYLLKYMKRCGINVHTTTPNEYVSYDLPVGWNMVNNSRREDLPSFHIIDNKNMIQFTISGSWGQKRYDDHLTITRRQKEHIIFGENVKRKFTQVFGFPAL